MNFIARFRYTLASGFVITFLSLLPQRHLPDSDIEYADIIVHVLMYATWMALCIVDLKRFQKQSGRYLIRISALVLLFYSGCLEMIQEGFVQGRHGSLTDFAANAAGIFTGVLFFQKQSRQLGQ